VLRPPIESTVNHGPSAQPYATSAVEREAVVIRAKVDMPQLR
jgi:hypothetical protein